MEQLNFNQLLLKTVFSCMACDGNIDDREVQLIKEMHSQKKLFGDIDIHAELDRLLSAINKEGLLFLKKYFEELGTFHFSEEEELKLIGAVIETIKVDEKVEYNEIKFFKVIRSKLKTSNEVILEKYPEAEEFLEEDVISESLIFRLQDDFLDKYTLPKFEMINILEESEQKEEDEKID
ncbi:TerB family tellurite resistance protein [Parabacteroides sp. PF5-9]|uniref:TerB family tellurite resistance protein n=1 Tax=Parabacteroides sp. PF5-9 TaxID=1742404 RepID=UPI002475E8D5|nr:TerB family tellurite resistance protein [Parabacteroides sp. PF5-9]MDH6357373.1 hypothetical protein [Parabacteroides sp. PF5-9]